MKQRMIIGVFGNTQSAKDAIDALKEYGVKQDDISVVMKDSKTAERFSKNTGKETNKGITIGAVGGLAVGAISGAAIGASIFVFPGGIFLAGPIATALGLTGTAATTVTGATTGTVTGGLLGGLLKLGITKDSAATYESQLKEGGVLIIVPAEGSDILPIENILKGKNANSVEQIQPVAGATKAES